MNLLLSQLRGLLDLLAGNGLELAPAIEHQVCVICYL